MTDKKTTTSDNTDAIADIMAKRGTNSIGDGYGGHDASIDAKDGVMSDDAPALTGLEGKPGAKGNDGVVGVEGEDGEDGEDSEGGSPKPPPSKKKRKPTGSAPKGAEKPQPGQAKGKSGKGKGGEGDGEGEGEGESSGTGGEGGKPDSGDDGKDREGAGDFTGRNPSPEDLAKSHAAASKAAENALDGGGESTAGKEAEQKTPASNKIGTGSSSGQSNGMAGRGRGAGSMFDFSNIKPSMTWKGILAKLVTTAIDHTESSYLKPSSKSITSIVQADNLGAAAIKPADKISDLMRPKLVIVMDGSGSMQSAIALANSNIIELFKKNPALAQETFFYVKFSDGHDTYLCNIKNKTAVSTKLDPKIQVSTSQITALGGAGTTSLTTVMSSSMSGGTVFEAPLTTELAAMAAKGYNILIISDDDLTGGANFRNLLNLYKLHKSKIFLILSNKQEWQNLVQKMGGSNPPNFSHM